MMGHGSLRVGTFRSSRLAQSLGRTLSLPMTKTEALEVNRSTSKEMAAEGHILVDRRVYLARNSDIVMR